MASRDKFLTGACIDEVIDVNNVHGGTWRRGAAINDACSIMTFRGATDNALNSILAPEGGPRPAHRKQHTIWADGTPIEGTDADMLGLNGAHSKVTLPIIRHLDVLKCIFEIRTGNEQLLPWINFNAA